MGFEWGDLLTRYFKFSSFFYLKVLVELLHFLLVLRTTEPDKPNLNKLFIVALTLLKRVKTRIEAITTVS